MVYGAYLLFLVTTSLRQDSEGRIAGKATRSVNLT